MSILRHGGIGEDKLFEEIKSQMSGQSSTESEFPLSSMSETLFHAVRGLPQPPKDSLGLDVGTGTGIHAFLLNRIGFRHVLAIDSNEIAINLACERGLRLGIECRRLQAGEARSALQSDNNKNTDISFVPIALQELAAVLDVKFQLMLFNPPGFFFVRNTDLRSPAASGVYAGHSRSALDFHDSLLFQFFAKVVLPLLSPGGEVICTWPGLERRTVELDPRNNKPGSPSHPASLLEAWLDLNVDCTDRNPDPFYCHTAIVSRDYGLGDAFWQNLDHALQNPNCYSTLVKASDWKHGGCTTFRFGILHLRRSQSAPFQFEIVPTGGDFQCLS